MIISVSFHSWVKANIGPLFIESSLLYDYRSREVVFRTLDECYSCKRFCNVY